MCKSKLEGGGRCYSHTNKEYQATLVNIDNAKKELDRKQTVLAKINFNIEMLDQQQADGNINDEDYNNNLDTLIGYREHGKQLIQEDRENLVKLEKRADAEKAEVQTTAKGIKLLREEIANTEDPEERRNLTASYNLGRKINKKRLEASKRFIANKEEAEKLRSEARSIAEEAKGIKGQSVEHDVEREEKTIAAHKLFAAAHLKEHNGNMEVQTLYSAKTGESVPAKLIDGKYGKVWAILSDPKDPSSKPSQLISPPRGKTTESREAFYEKKGMVLGTSWVPGKATVQQDEYNNRKVVLERTDGGYSRFSVRGSDNWYAEQRKKANQKKLKEDKLEKVS